MSTRFDLAGTMKILVTGTAGFLGKHIAAHLTRGHSVTGFDLGESAPEATCCGSPSKQSAVTMWVSRQTSHHAAMEPSFGYMRGPTFRSSLWAEAIMPAQPQASARYVRSDDSQIGFLFTQFGVG